MQLFVRAVTYLLSLFASLNNPQKQSNGGSLSNVQENAADSTLTSSNAKGLLLRVIRNPRLATTDAHFGAMDYNGQTIGVTMERKAVAIPEGTYNAHLEMSPHFGFQTPHIDVPQRTYIEIHPANYPAQLEGCVAVGLTKDGGALDNSKQAFDNMMALVPNQFTVEVSSLAQSFPKYL